MSNIQLTRLSSDCPVLRNTWVCESHYRFRDDRVSLRISRDTPLIITVQRTTAHLEPSSLPLRWASVGPLTGARRSRTRDDPTLPGGYSCISQLNVEISHVRSRGFRLDRIHILDGSPSL
jgi:hypothetical protein